ncbi:MAG: MBL fold metallo-hydrolase [Flavobacteriaceae bacterium]|nr:MBL fold metallo-hydrolase [Flavobacteriaceae bacterium]
MKKNTVLKFIFCLLLLIACNENKDNLHTDINSEWFDIDDIGHKTYSLEEPKSDQHNVSYLLLGDSKAIVFDTGSGENKAINGFKIKPIIDELTKLPVTLLMSHFHFDHNQNIHEFSNIGFPDLSFLKNNVSSNDIYTFTSEDLFYGNYPSEVKVNKWLPINTDIDLGNRIIQLVNIPGHTDESIAIIDKTNKMAFLGDYLYNGTLFLFNNNDITLYKKSIKHLVSILDSDYKLFGAHGSPKIEYNKLSKLNNFLICIENNECQYIAEKLWGEDVFIYKYEGMEILIFQ